MPISKIKSIKAREILDSRGNPTVEVELATDGGVFLDSVPAGVSKGKYEAVELRDGGERYLGRGVLKAIRNIKEIIAPELEGTDVKDQKKIDKILIDLDGTKNKSKLGANAILAVSMAVCRAGAKAKNLSLWQHIAEISGTKKPILPIPCLLCIEGGLHAGNNLDIQEFMIAPEAESYKERLRIGAETYHTLGSILKQKYGESATNIGDEGGFAAPLEKTEQALDLIMEAIHQAGYDNRIKIVLDVAASSFFKEGIYQFEGTTLNRKQLLEFYSKIIEKYPLESIEDPFAEEDWEGFKAITERFGKKVVIIGDDLLVTNLERIKKAVKENSCSGFLLKLNQIGTVTEAIEAAKYAMKNGWRVMVSQRGGETCDSFFADLAVGLGCGWIKAGAPARGERLAKYNRLLKIEEELLSES
ncbi:phosphopyruvate hydratase [Patescibacteria group bacterium]|nr:phosphopyruvate hydratase [Patescibacteria group bacterium]